MKVDKKLLVFVTAAVLVGGGLLAAAFNTQADLRELGSSSVRVEARAELIIDLENSIEKEVNLGPGQTVFDLLKEGGVEFNYENYESGVFITSIEGVSEPTKHWMYYVNGKLGKKAVDQKIIGNGDVVEFKNQKPPF